MPRPIVEPGHTEVTLRDDLTPPEPIEVDLTEGVGWLFDPADAIDNDLLWRGEGPRCQATFPPTMAVSTLGCELVADHPERGVPWHLARRSSV